MKAGELIDNELENFSENELIFASQLYRQKLSKSMTETAFYKALSEKCKKNELTRVQKGIYSKPRESKFGLVIPGDNETIKVFTAENKGTIVGYRLYNKLRLTTQVPKTAEVYSNVGEYKSCQIGNVRINLLKLDFTWEVASLIQTIDILQNFHQIQDINYTAFLEQCKKIESFYSDSLFEYVYSQMRCPKSTVSFLKEVLDEFSIKNNLGRELSSLSKYKHPKMEEIYELARISQ